MKVVIAGNYGAKNSGDELILSGLLYAIEEINPAAEITVLSGDPEETAKKYNVNSEQKFPAGIRSWLRYRFFSTPRTERRTRECDYFILGGGGLFGSLTFSANVIWALQAITALRYKRKLIIYGQSIGELDGPIRKMIVKHVFSKAHTVALRDSQSIDRLIKLGLSREISTMPDLAFRKPYIPTNKKKEKTLLISLRELGAKGQAVGKIVAHFIDWIKEHEGWNIEIIDLQGGDGAEGDKKVHEKLVNLTKDTKEIKYHGYVGDSSELLKIFEQAKIVLGMRLHSLIAATKTATPFIALSYEPKVEGFLKSANQKTQGIDIKNLTLDKLKLLFRQTERDYANIQHNQNEYAKKTIEEHERVEKSTLRKLLQDD